MVNTESIQNPLLTQLLEKWPLHQVCTDRDIFDILDWWKEASHMMELKIGSCRIIDLEEQPTSRSWERLVNLVQVFDWTGVSNNGTVRHFYALGLVAIPGRYFVLYNNGYNGGGTTQEALQDIINISDKLDRAGYRSNLCHVGLDPLDEVYNWVFCIRPKSEDK